MKLIIDKNRKVYSAGTWGTKNENNYEILNFEFPEELEEYNKRIVYYLDDKRVWDAIVYNKAYITNAITKYEKVNAYVWLTKNETITLKYVCDGTEEGNYYFTYDNANYYFTMPEVEENDELIFDVATSTLKLDNTTIATTTTGTGTELTFETIIDAEEDFRTQLFEMQFYENENASGIVPTEEQVDGFNTMLTAMNAKIDEVDALEQTIGTAEAQRQENENARISNESTRQSNESTRESNEQTRQTQEADRERRTDEAIGNIEDKTAEYNANAEAKTTAFNNNATQKTNDFNSNYTQKVNDFNTNASSKELAFNSNAISKTSAFNSNAETKTNAFNTNATNKTNAFNSNTTEKTTTFNNNASTKTSEFNTNAENKTSAFNDNATQKTTNFDNNATSKTGDFNDNATAKTTAFNDNAQAKTEAFDEHTAEITADIEDLQQEVEELSENMPWNTTEQATEISVDDAAKYSRNKLELFGNTEQAQYTGVQLLDMSDTVNGYFTSDEGGTNNAINGFRVQKYIDVGNNTSVYGRFEALANIKIGRFWIQEYDENYNSLRRTLLSLYDRAIENKEVRKGSITLLDNTKFIRIAAYSLKELVNEEYVERNPMKDSWNDLVKATISFTNVDIYEPYVGSVPSPNPNYPQDIHVVTGENTIHVNNTDYIIDLNDIELGNAMNYQEYFFKNEPNNPHYNNSLIENAWYRYERLKKMNLRGKILNASAKAHRYSILDITPKINYAWPSIQQTRVICDKYRGVSQTYMDGNPQNYCISGRNRDGLFIYDKDKTLSEIQDYFNNNDVIIYYVRETPLSTQITDETLIAQLNEIYEHLKLVKGTNNISITASDLKPYMQLSYMQDLPSKLDNLDSRLSLLE